jgi:hypothetical protein
MHRLTAAAVAAMIALGAGQALAGAGTFSGLSNHVTTGSVEVVETGEGWQIRLGPDFSFDGAPDPRVGFGKGGKFADGTDFEVLRANNGEQVYKVPAEIDPADFDQVYIWCRKFAVPLGAAPIE